MFKVYFPQASKEYRMDGSCFALAKKTVLMALGFCLVLYALVDVVAFTCLDIILGEEWVEVKYTLLILSLFEILPMIFLPISGTWFIADKHDLNLVYQIGRSMLIMVGLTIGVTVGGYYSTIIAYGFFRSIAFSLFLRKCLLLSRGEV